MPADITGDFVDPLTSPYGGRPKLSWRTRRLGPVMDPIFGARLGLSGAYRRLAKNAAALPRRSVLVLGVDVPARHDDLARMFDAFRASRHRVETRFVPLGDRGKFQNINLGLAEVDIASYDWVLVVDDDVGLPPDFLDRFLFVAEAAGLAICQPAHCFDSHTSWQVTQRVWGSLARTTGFVECGPVTAFHKSSFAWTLPFPDTRWAWGIDVLWAALAERHGARIGIVDATPIRHLRPVGASYSREAAVADGHALLSRFDAMRDARQLLRTTSVMRSLPVSA